MTEVINQYGAEKTYSKTLTEDGYWNFCKQMVRPPESTPYSSYEYIALGIPGVISSPRVASSVLVSYYTTVGKAFYPLSSSLEEILVPFSFSSIASYGYVMGLALYESDYDLKRKNGKQMSVRKIGSWVQPLAVSGSATFPVNVTLNENKLHYVYLCFYSTATYSTTFYGSDTNLSSTNAPIYLDGKFLDLGSFSSSSTILFQSAFINTADGTNKWDQVSFPDNPFVASNLQPYVYYVSHGTDLFVCGKFK